MSTENSNETAQHICNMVIGMYNAGKSQSDIVHALELIGLSNDDSNEIVDEIISTYSKRIKNFGKYKLLASNKIIKEILYFFFGLFFVLILSFLFSFLLGFIKTLLEMIGLKTIGGLIARFGGDAAGMFLGTFGTFLSRESRSLGMLVGCWAGAFLYYWLIFSSN